MVERKWFECTNCGKKALKTWEECHDSEDDYIDPDCTCGFNMVMVAR